MGTSKKTRHDGAINRVATLEVITTVRFPNQLDCDLNLSVRTLSQSDLAETGVRCSAHAGQAILGGGESKWTRHPSLVFSIPLVITSPLPDKLQGKLNLPHRYLSGLINLTESVNRTWSWVKN